MLTKTRLSLALVFPLVFLACSKPTPTPGNATHELFEFSPSTHLRWGMNKSEITSFLTPTKYDEAWNSKRIRASFATFGEVEYSLHFNFDTDLLFRTDIELYKGNNFELALSNYYELYKYLLSINFTFSNNPSNLNQNDFNKRTRKLMGIDTTQKSKFTFLQFIGPPGRNQYEAVIGLSPESIENEYSVVFRITRS